MIFLNLGYVCGLASFRIYRGWSCGQFRWALTYLPNSKNMFPKENLWWFDPHSILLDHVISSFRPTQASSLAFKLVCCIFLCFLPDRSINPRKILDFHHPSTPFNGQATFISAGASFGSPDFALGRFKNKIKKRSFA